MKNITLTLDHAREYKLPVSIFLVWLISISGIVGIYAVQADWFLPKTPFNLTVNFLLLLWHFPAKNYRSLFIWFTVFLIGMSVEIAGVQTGLLFGEYHYGDNLGIKVWDVPVLIGINWAVLTFLTAVISRKIFGNAFITPFIAAALMVGLDFFIEPSAPLFDFWHWAIGSAPLQNYITWFLVALALQFLVKKEIDQQDYRLPLHMFASQLVFFSFFYGVYHI